MTEIPPPQPPIWDHGQRRMALVQSVLQEVLNGHSYEMYRAAMLAFNLANVPAYRDTVRAMRGRLFGRLEATGGMLVPVRRGDFQAGERRVP